MSEVQLIDAIREAIIAFRDEEQSSNNISDRQIAIMLGISAPQLARLVEGGGTAIRASTLNGMLPHIRKYLNEEELAYCRAGGEGDWTVSVGLHVKGPTFYEQLAHWIAYEARPADREMVVSMAQRCGFKADGEHHVDLAQELMKKKREGRRQGRG